MRRAVIFVFSFFLLAVITANAQNDLDWTIPGDRIEETEGRGLVVRSNPSGAKVFIDGIEWGITPLRMSDVRPGRYIVLVKKDGYNERWFRVMVRQGSVMDVSVELKESEGNILLKIERASGSPGPEKLPLNPEITGDGVSFPSAALVLPTGFRNIVVRAFGWEEVSTTVYVETDSYKEVELNLKPAPFKVFNGSQTRSRFNPSNAGSLGTTSISFDVSAPGRGTFTVMDDGWNPVFVRPLAPFEAWSQSVVWDGRNSRGEVLPDGLYTLVLSAVSVPWDDSAPVEDGFVFKTELDSTRIIHPLSLASGKSGLLFAPLPSPLPTGSFQIEGNLLAGSPPESGGPWTSLPFAAGFRFTPVRRLEVSAALNVIARFEGKAGAGISGGVKWAYLQSGDSALPLSAAAGFVFSWTGKTGLTPFGMASGFELYFPFKLDLGSIFSVALSPAALWTGDEGFPWGPVPRLLVSGGFMMKMTYFSAGLSIRTEYNFHPENKSAGNSAWPPSIITGGEIRFFPPPSSFVFSFMGGVWIRDNNFGGFGGIGIGMIY